MATARNLTNMAPARVENPNVYRSPTHESCSGSATTEFTSDGILVFGPFCLSIGERWLRKGSTRLNLSSRAFDILIALIARAGSIVSTRELFQIVWPDVVVEASNLRVHIVALRKALEDGANGVRYVINVPGRGYMFVAPIRKALATSDASPVLRSQHKIPAISQPLFGRAETVEKVSSMILSRRFVSVVGPGGVGKTTVAIAAANALSPTFGSNGIFFLDLASTTDPTLGLAVLLSIAPCPIDHKNTRDAILGFVSDKRMLLVLDNCEHVLGSIAPLAARIFDEAPSVHLLMTSREPLRADGENVEFLAPLDHSPASSASGDRPPAVELFLARAAAGGGPLSLGAAETATVREICRCLDGLPLAIELVASRMGTLGLLGISELVEQGAILTLQGRRNASPRHQTLEALVDWSFNLLSMDEQKLLLKLSKIPEPFTLQAVRSLCVESGWDGTRTANGLAGLVDKSVIQVSRSHTPMHYQLLNITRAYCAHRRAIEPDGPLDILKQVSTFPGLGQPQFNADLASIMVKPHRFESLSTALEAG